MTDKNMMELWPKLNIIERNWVRGAVVGKKTGHWSSVSTDQALLIPRNKVNEFLIDTFNTPKEKMKDIIYAVAWLSLMEKLSEPEPEDFDLSEYPS